MKTLQALDDYFKSGNNIPVSRATIKIEEWDSFRAELDALMAEYCPEEMSAEQWDSWAKHQRPYGWKLP